MSPMLKWSFAIAMAAVLIAIYCIWIRPYFKRLPQFADVYAKEQNVWTALSIWIENRRTILIGIWGQVVAFAPDLLQIFAGVDLKTAFGLPDTWAVIIGGVIVPILMMIFRTKAKPLVP